MTDVEQIQHTAKDLSNAAISSTKTLATSVKAIAAAHADYAKKSMEHGSEFISQIVSVKEPAKLMELHSEYVKYAYETFAAEAKKISELYTDLFKQMAQPLQNLIEKKAA